MQISDLNSQREQPDNHAKAMQIAGSVLLSTGIGLLAYLFRDSKRPAWYQAAAILMFIFAGAAALFPKIVVVPVYERYRRLKDKNFIARKKSQLDKFATKFLSFSARDDLGSIHRPMQEVARTIGKGDLVSFTPFINDWSICFMRSKDYRTYAIQPFICLCQEFSLIVESFNVAYIQLAQEKICCTSGVNTHYMKDLRTFQYQFNQFLEDLVEFEKSIRDYAKKRLPDQEAHFISPTAYHKAIGPFLSPPPSPS